MTERRVPPVEARPKPGSDRGGRGGVYPAAAAGAGSFPCNLDACSTVEETRSMSKETMRVHIPICQMRWHSINPGLC